MELNLDNTIVTTMGGTRKLEIELDGQELQQVKEVVRPTCSTVTDCRIRKEGKKNRIAKASTELWRLKII